MLNLRFQNIRFVIPTYKRYDVKTLELLKSHSVDIKQIYLFVADNIEYEIYKNKYPEYKIIIGILGLANQRNFICNYFREDDFIVSMDDDLTKFNSYLLTETQIALKHNTLQYMILNGFKRCIELKAFIFGVSQTDNEYFMKNSITVDFTFIIGHFFGFINRKCDDLKIECDQKEDYERCIKYFIKDKIMIKFNNYSFKTNTYTNKGGMQTNPNRILDSDARAKILLEQYKDYISLKTCKSKYIELRLNKVKSNYKVVNTLDTINKNNQIVLHLLKLLNNTNLLINSKRTSVGKGITQTFGKSHIRRKKGIHDCKNNFKYPELFLSLIELIKFIKPDFTYTTIQLNKNFKSNPHIDLNNKGEGLIIGLGDYEGGKTTINGLQYDIKYKPTIFNASKWIHSNELPITGDRYSICYFTLI